MPPPYTTQDGDASSLSPPSYYSSSIHPYRSFPPIIKAYLQHTSTTFHLCGADGSENRLFAVEGHTGLSGKSPLGARPGLILFNGPKAGKDVSVLATAGDESQWSHRYYAFSLDSLVQLPQIEDEDMIKNAPGLMTMERMHATTHGGKEVAFVFSVEVGDKMRREPFEWRKVDKDTGKSNDESRSGFELIRISPKKGAHVMNHKLEQQQQQGGASSSSSSNSKETHESVALLTWAKLLSKQAFTLAFMGSGLTGELGERWVIMAVMTACRLWYMSLNGRTTKSHIAAAEKIHRK